MAETSLIPAGALNPSGSYIVPQQVPHFGGMRFDVPERALHTGLVIYSSGLNIAKPQPMGICVHPDFLYLADIGGMVWARQYQKIRRVGQGGKTTVIVPVQTRQSTTGWILEEAATVEVSFSSKMGGEISLVLATLLPDQAPLWVARINQARIAYEDRFEAAAGEE